MNLKAMLVQPQRRMNFRVLQDPVGVEGYRDEFEGYACPTTEQNECPGASGPGSGLLEFALHLPHRA
jgi:hypothetical protein